VTYYPATTTLIFGDVCQERKRQEEIHPDKTPACVMSNAWRHVILSEEVGEVAEAVQGADRAELKKELIQVAAVCFAWLQSIYTEELWEMDHAEDQ
jgi:hypothetical protein